MSRYPGRPGTVAQLTFSESWGGLEKAALDWTARFRGIGRDSLCVCTKGSPLAHYLAEAGLEAATMPRPNRYFSPRCVKQLRTLFRERDVRTLFLHSSKDLWLATLAADPARTRVLYFNRMINHTVMKRDFVHRLIHSKLEHVIALSNEAKCGLLHTTTLAARDISVIPDCIDPARFQATRKEASSCRRLFGIGENTLMLLSVGRLDPKKGQWELIQAMHALVEKGLDIALVLVGARTLNEHQEYEKRLRQYVMSCGLTGRVHFTGHQDHVAPFYRAADVFVLPSHAETFGLVLLEAMLFSLPIIATNRGAVPEIIEDGRSGILIEPQTPRFAAEAIERLYHDRALRARLGAAGEARVRARYQADVIARRVDDIARAAWREPMRARRSHHRFTIRALTWTPNRTKASRNTNPGESRDP